MKPKMNMPNTGNGNSDSIDESFGDVHCMPNDNKHECSNKCWCDPELKADFRDENGKRLWMHRELQ